MAAEKDFSMGIVELDPEDARTVSKFQAFYDGVFSKCFPRDEIGSAQAYLDIKEGERPSGGAYEYHLTFMEDADRYLACFIYCWFPKIKMLAAEFACVEEHYRGKGLAKTLMKHVEQKHDFKWMFGEVEEDNQTNLFIWKKYGFKHIPIKYQQLSLGDGRKPVDSMKLCVYSKDEHLNKISLDNVRQFIWHYYKYSQFCNDPNNTKTIQMIDNELNCVKMLKLLPL